MPGGSLKLRGRVAAVLGDVDHGLAVAQTFLHENRIRQAASSLGAAQYCIDRAVGYANDRTVFGKPLAVNQAVHWIYPEKKVNPGHSSNLAIFGQKDD